MDISQKRFVVSIYEIRQELVFAEEFSGALIPTTSFTEAERIATQITAEAAKDGHPLICRPVSIVP